MIVKFIVEVMPLTRFAIFLATSKSMMRHSYVIAVYGEGIDGSTRPPVVGTTLRMLAYPMS